MSILAIVATFLEIISSLAAIFISVRKYQEMRNQRDVSVTQTNVVATIPKTREILNAKLKNGVFGMGAILLALANLAFYTFGPEQSAVLTAGATASIATSLILALAGLSVLRS